MAPSSGHSLGLLSYNQLSICLTKINLSFSLCYHDNTRIATMVMCEIRYTLHFSFH